MSKIMNDVNMCQWLRDTSSGVYRQSGFATDRIEFLIEWIKCHGEQTDTCTKDILGVVCDDCQCGEQKNG